MIRPRRATTGERQLTPMAIRSTVSWDVMLSAGPPEAFRDDTSACCFSFGWHQVALWCELEDWALPCESESGEGRGPRALASSIASVGPTFPMGCGAWKLRVEAGDLVVGRDGHSMTIDRHASLSGTWAAVTSASPSSPAILSFPRRHVSCSVHFRPCRPGRICGRRPQQRRHTERGLADWADC